MSVATPTGPPRAVGLTRKEIRLIPTRSGIVSRSLRTTYRSIALLFPEGGVLLLLLRHEPLDEVVRDPDGGGLEAVEPPVDRRRRAGNVQEDVRQLLREDLLDPEVRHPPLLGVEGAGPILQAPIA